MWKLSGKSRTLRSAFIINAIPPTAVRQDNVVSLLFNESPVTSAGENLTKTNLLSFNELCFGVFQWFWTEVAQDLPGCSRNFDEPRCTLTPNLREESPCPCNYLMKSKSLKCRQDNEINSSDPVAIDPRKPLKKLRAIVRKNKTIWRMSKCTITSIFITFTTFWNHDLLAPLEG